MRRKLHVLALAVVVLATGLVTEAANANTSAAPAVGNFSPKQGTVGSKVTIVGSDLGGAQVSFDGIAAASVTVNRFGNALVAVVPNIPELGAGSALTMTVTTPEGTANVAGSFVMTGLPVSKVTPDIVSFMPMKGAPGTKVTIRGANLRNIDWVELGGSKMFYKAEGGKIVAIVPAKAHTGKITLKTVGGVASAHLRFTVLGAASL